MTGPFVDQDEINFNHSIAAFEAATDIDIQYEGTKEFESIISTRVDGGDAPDIADFPQPGLLKNFVRDGKVVDVGGICLPITCSGQYLESWLDMANMKVPTATLWPACGPASMARALCGTTRLPGRGRLRGSRDLGRDDGA